MNAEEKQLIRRTLKLIDAMMPGVRYIALQDYKELNEVPLALNRVVEAPLIGEDAAAALVEHTQRVTRSMEEMQRVLLRLGHPITAKSCGFIAEAGRNLLTEYGL